MIFVFNENGCKGLVAFNTRLLEHIMTEIAFLENERDSATELEVRFAIEEALAKSQFNRSTVEIKIRELEQYLKSAATVI